MIRIGTWLCVVAMTVALARADERKLIIGSSYTAPFSTIEGDGYFDLLVREACNVAGSTCEVRMLPPERSLIDAAQGKLDGDVGRVDFVPEAFPDLLRVAHPVLRGRRFVAFARNHGIRIAGWESLRPYNLAYVNGWKIFDAPTAGARSVTRVANMDQLFGLLDKGRIDIALAADIEGLATIRRLGLEGVRMLEPPLDVRDLYLLLHIRHASLSKDLGPVLARLEHDGSMRRLLDQATANFIVRSR